MKLCVLPLHGCQSESSITADGMNAHLAKPPTNISTESLMRNKGKNT